MTLKVNTITDTAGTGAPDASNGVTIKGTALSSVSQMEYTASSSEPTSPSGGALWFDTSDDTFKMYLNDLWYTVEYTPPPVWYGDTGVFAGGSSGATRYNVMQSVTISTTGNATDFGDLTVARTYLAGCSSGSRGTYGGGYDGSATNTIDYITFATSGNATDFGDLTLARYGLSSCSDSSRGLFFGGYASAVDDTIDYITIATAGNATDYGDLDITNAGGYFTASCADSTRGIIAGGSNFEFQKRNEISYVTIQTLGNTTDFGDLLAATADMGGCSDATRGIFAGGTATQGHNVIQYITIQTTGNSADFGDLTLVRPRATAISNGTRAVIGGGALSATAYTIDYITIQTLGNASDFGDQTIGLSFMGGASGD